MNQATKRLASGLFAVWLGCAGSAAPVLPPPVASSGHGYALLYAILGQEKNVSQLLVIKGEREPLEAVIDAIAETCGKAYEKLGELAARSPRIDLSDTGLPKEELKTRELIGATRRDLLLGSSGRELELQLLVIQSEALTYAAHLADTLSRSEADPERAAFVRALWQDLTRHLHDVQALLRKG